jgi:hypothetical protein
MTTITTTREAVASLAIRYGAYSQAADARSIALWGRMLMKSQEETGVVLVPQDQLAMSIDTARMIIRDVEGA